MHKFDDPILLNCKSGAEFLLTLLTPFLNSINQMKKSYEKFYNNGHHGKLILFETVFIIYSCDFELFK